MTVVAAIGLAAVCHPAMAGNLLVNGHFEEPVVTGTEWDFTGTVSFAGWSAFSTGNGGNAGIDVGIHYGLGPSDGNQYFSFNGLNPPAGTYLEQTFITIKGVQYTVAFDIGRNNGVFDQYLALDVQAFDSASGHLLANEEALPPSTTGWSQASMTFTADSGLSRLRFTDISGDNPNTDVSLDNVTVVPEPVTLSLLALGGLALMRRRR